MQIRVHVIASHLWLPHERCALICFIKPILGNRCVCCFISFNPYWGIFTARSRKDKTRNARSKCKSKSSMVKAQFSFQLSRSKRDLGWPSRISVCPRWPFWVSSSQERAVRSWGFFLSFLVANTQLNHWVSSKANQAWVALFYSTIVGESCFCLLRSLGFLASHELVLVRALFKHSSRTPHPWSNGMRFWLVIRTGKLQPIFRWREKPILLTLPSNLTWHIPAS